MIELSNLRLKSKVNGLFLLRGSWFKAMAIVVILSLLSFGITELDTVYRNVFDIQKLTDNGLISTDYRSFIIEAVFSLITFLVMTPLILGTIEWFWNLSGGAKTGVGDIFAWYGSIKLYGKSLLLGLDVGIRCFFWGLLTCGIPSAMLVAANCLLAKIPISSNFRLSDFTATELQRIILYGILGMFGAILLLGGILLYLYITSRYILSFFLMAEDNNRKISEVVKNSVKYSRSYRWEITKFILSFIGWFIICIAVFPLLFVVPYFCSSAAILSKHIIYSQRPSENKSDTISFDAQKDVQ